MNEKKSPLKAKPRRVAGQSVQEELDKLQYAAMDKGMLAVVAVVLLLLEFWKWFSKAPPSPLGVSIVCAPLFVYSICKLVSLRKQINRLKQGLDGEKIVGEKLENLRVLGYRVFHDLIGGPFNVDHVLAGPAGVFTVETKTWSKGKGDKIDHNGEVLWKNGIEVKPNPIDQAKAQARWLYGLIKELTNENVFVQPVIVFPGWWVEPPKVAKPRALVLNPDQLEGVLKTLPMKLEQNSIGFISKRLELLASDMRSSSWETRAKTLESFYDPAKTW
ncbi:MAG TPA: nuclease-related domain-containing protein [Candidatus Acidoferrum sp.]|nr:nuclease-related domain-containing protein [Candidatus Acidoferrum sp.]